MSFRLSFHLPLLGPSGAHWLDGPPDTSCKDDTRQYAADSWPLSCKHQLGVRVPPASSQIAEVQVLELGEHPLYCLGLTRQAVLLVSLGRGHLRLLLRRRGVGRRPLPAGTPPHQHGRCEESQ
jgi:hypothetical protein